MPAAAEHEDEAYSGRSNRSPNTGTFLIRAGFGGT